MNTQIIRWMETCCRQNMGYSFLLAVRNILDASSHSQDSTYHGLCYTNRGALAGKGSLKKKIVLAGTRGIDPMIHHTMSEGSTTKLHLAPDTYLHSLMDECT